MKNLLVEFIGTLFLVTVIGLTVMGLSAFGNIGIFLAANFLGGALAAFVYKTANPDE